MATEVSRPWNSPTHWSIPKVQEPSERPPRCACGGMFPLDTHPETGEKCCSKCYMEATRG